MAAACYAATRPIYTYSMEYADGVTGIIRMDGAWPWDSGWWKPKNRRHDLVRAAALVVAEIERLDRKSNQIEGEQPAQHPAPAPDAFPSPTRYTDGSYSREYEEQPWVGKQKSNLLVPQARENENAQPVSSEVVEKVAAAIAAYEWEYGMAETVREDFGLYLAENKREYDGKAKAALSVVPPQRDDSGLVEEMAEALKAINEFDDVQDRGSDSGGWQSEELEETFRKVAAALAKYAARAKAGAV